jgi:magnesium chelatase family protein
MKQINCASFNNGVLLKVNVESSFVSALPFFNIVGMANVTILESKERVKSALDYIGFKFPPKKIIINLSPSELNKNGSHFDLAIALLVSLQNVRVENNFEDFYIFGELGLDGSLKDSSSIFPLCLELAQQSAKGANIKVLAPIKSCDKLKKIPNISLYGVNNISDAISFFSPQNINEKENYKIECENLKSDFIEIKEEKYYYDNDYEFDFLDVKGQEIAKQASLISASGGHNIIFNGSAGSGKSMIAKRLPYIMPPLSLSQILNIAKLDCIGGKEPNFKPIAPFVSPHHSSSLAGVIGGTKIGEIALCDNGVLFFDELPHFSKSVLEALREPLQDNVISISRVNNKIKYNTNFVFVGAMNPCPCGNLLSVSKVCKCNDIEINRYKNKLSQPIMDRIDLFVNMDESKCDDKSSCSSKELRAKIFKAFKMQKNRGQKELNANIDDRDISKYCILNDEAQSIFDKAITSFALSFRGINKTLKVARTISDIEENEIIQKVHILQALSYRSR